MQKVIGERSINNIHDGKITVGEFNERAFAMIKAGKKEMLDFMKGKVVVRRGLITFMICVKRKEFGSLSSATGWDFYVKQILEDIGLGNVEYHSAETFFTKAGVTSPLYRA